MKESCLRFVLAAIFFAHDFLAHEFHEFSCKQVQSRTCSGYAERSRKCQEIYTNNKAFDKGDLVGRTNFH